jgi:hypothetical protein
MLVLVGCERPWIPATTKSLLDIASAQRANGGYESSLASRRNIVNGAVIMRVALQRAAPAQVWTRAAMEC